MCLNEIWNLEIYSLDSIRPIFFSLSIYILIFIMANLLKKMCELVYASSNSMVQYYVIFQYAKKFNVTQGQHTQTAYEEISQTSRQRIYIISLICNRKINNAR